MTTEKEALRKSKQHKQSTNAGKQWNIHKMREKLPRLAPRSDRRSLFSEHESIFGSSSWHSILEDWEHVTCVCVMFLQEIIALTES